MAKANTDPTLIWQEFQTQGVDYQKRMGFTHTLPMFTNFVEGKQWPASTEKTKYMPRPVINQCDFIVENKKSNILSQTLKSIFSPEEIHEDEEETNQQAIEASQMFSDAISTIDEEMEQEELDENSVNDTLILGTGITHYYFDSSYKGGEQTPFKGNLAGETIDPLDICLGNPHLSASKIQKQPYIIIRTFPNTLDVKAEAEKNGKDATQITSDSESQDNASYDSQKIAPTKPNTTTCLIKYYKENGQVWWMKSTEKVAICDPKPLSPNPNRPFTLYPIDILTFKSRRKCTFGRSIIEDIIPNQKALNWGIGMMLLSIQQTAWPKIIAKMNALQQQITNEPGEILIDHYPQAGVDGMKYMQPPNFSSTPMIITEKIMDMTRQVTGTTEINSGEVIGANMAASAIIALQNQAQKPNQHYQKMFVRSRKRIGRIKEEFIKTYFSLPRPISSKTEEGKEITKVFTGTDFENKSFKLKMDVGVASEYSEALQMTVVQGMYDKKDITKYQFVRYSPKNLTTTEMREDFEKEEKQLEEQQQAQMEMQKQAEGITNQLRPDEAEMLANDPSIMADAQKMIGGAENEM